MVFVSKVVPVPQERGQRLPITSLWPHWFSPFHLVPSPLNMLPSGLGHPAPSSLGPPKASELPPHPNLPKVFSERPNLFLAQFKTASISLWELGADNPILITRAQFLVTCAALTQGRTKSSRTGAFMGACS